MVSPGTRHQHIKPVCLSVCPSVRPSVRPSAGRALSAEHQKIPEVKVDGRSRQLQLVELHLGEAQATADQIKAVLAQLPQLRLLRHYQLVSALCQLHAADWREGRALPAYKLRNLDADFSHVVSECQLSARSGR